MHISIQQIATKNNINRITVLIPMHRSFQLGWSHMQITTIEYHYVKLWKQITISIMLTTTSKRTGNSWCSALVWGGIQDLNATTVGSIEGWSRLLKQLIYQPSNQMLCASFWLYKIPKIRMKPIKGCQWGFPSLSFAAASSWSLFFQYSSNGGPNIAFPDATPIL